MVIPPSRFKSANPLKRESPRITLNKLAEFVLGRPARQRSLLMEQQAPKTCILVNYDPFRWGCQEIMVTGEFRGFQMYPRYANDQSLQTSLEAIDAFQLKVLPQLREAGYTFHPLPREKASTMIVEGVTVSLRPDFLITRKRRGVTEFGYLKLNTSKSAPLSKEGLKIVASVLYEKACSESSEMISSRQMCVAADVFEGVIECAPVHNKRIWKDVEAGCKHIAVLWPTLKARR